MGKYAAVIEYDGTGFKGFQAQPGNVRTIQGEVTSALEVLLKDYNQFSYAGRTDAGVHARHQVISFSTENSIDFYRFKWKLNCLLPDDIVVREMRSVPDSFDARKDAKWRQYSYFVVNNNYQSVFLEKYSVLITKKLNIKAMRIAADRFLGIRDFASFCNNNLQIGSTIREIRSFRIKTYPDRLLVFRIEASSFLYNMVRIIVGTVLEIGKGERTMDSIDIAFKGKSRKLAGKIVPAKGLFLTNVEY